MINSIKKVISLNNLDGYLVPKNDKYFRDSVVMTVHTRNIGT